MKEFKKLYREKEVIGRGNFGSATLVEKIDNKNEYIAKKIVLSSLNPKQQEAALQEAQLLKDLNHKNVVAYVESFKEGDMLIIIMEYCQHGDLGIHIKRKKQKKELFPEMLIVNWFYELSLAVKYIHEKKILHRDIKTTNIFITKDGTIKIGDFGISKILENTTSVAKTVVGTPYYMSPEVCESKPYTYRSDIWSLGCVLFELCSLEHVFESNNLLGLIFKIVKQDIPDIPSSYSKELNELVHKLLNKNEQERPIINEVLSDPCTQKLFGRYLEVRPDTPGNRISPDKPVHIQSQKQEKVEIIENKQDESEEEEVHLEQESDQVQLQAQEEEETDNQKEGVEEEQEEYYYQEEDHNALKGKKLKKLDYSVKQQKIHAQKDEQRDVPLPSNLSKPQQKKEVAKKEEINNQKKGELSKREEIKQKEEHHQVKLRELNSLMHQQSCGRLGNPAKGGVEVNGGEENGSRFDLLPGSTKNKSKPNLFNDSEQDLNAKNFNNLLDYQQKKMTENGWNTSNMLTPTSSVHKFTPKQIAQMKKDEKNRKQQAELTEYVKSQSKNSLISRERYIQNLYGDKFMKNQSILKEYEESIKKRPTSNVLLEPINNQRKLPDQFQQMQFVSPTAGAANGFLFTQNDLPQQDNEFPIQCYSQMNTQGNFYQKRQKTENSQPLLTEEPDDRPISGSEAKQYIPSIKSQFSKKGEEQENVNDGNQEIERGSEGGGDAPVKKQSKKHSKHSKDHTEHQQQQQQQKQFFQTNQQKEGGRWVDSKKEGGQFNLRGVNGNGASSDEEYQQEQFEDYFSDEELNKNKKDELRKLGLVERKSQTAQSSRQSTNPKQIPSRNEGQLMKGNLLKKGENRKNSEYEQKGGVDAIKTLPDETSSQYQNKLHTLRNKCKQNLGNHFETVYAIIKKSVDQNLQKYKMKQLLVEVVGKARINDCFEVEMLIFQEEEENSKKY